MGSPRTSTSWVRKLRVRDSSEYPEAASPGGAAAAQKRAYPGQEDPPGHRLDQVLVGTQVEPANHVVLAAQCAEHQKMDVGHLADAADELEPVHAGHAQVR